MYIKVVDPFNTVPKTNDAKSYNNFTTNMYIIHSNYNKS